LDIEKLVDTPSAPDFSALWTAPLQLGIFRRKKDLLYNKITSKKSKGEVILTGIKKRKYSQEFKEEIVQRALSDERILVLGKEHIPSPGLINRRI